MVRLARMRGAGAITDEVSVARAGVETPDFEEKSVRIRDRNSSVNPLLGERERVREFGSKSVNRRVGVF